MQAKIELFDFRIFLDSLSLNISVNRDLIPTVQFMDLLPLDLKVLSLKADDKSLNLGTGIEFLSRNDCFHVFKAAPLYVYFYTMKSHKFAGLGIDVHPLLVDAYRNSGKPQTFKHKSDLENAYREIIGKLTLQITVTHIPANIDDVECLDQLQGIQHKQSTATSEVIVLQDQSTASMKKAKTKRTTHVFDPFPDLLYMYEDYQMATNDFINEAIPVDKKASMAIQLRQYQKNKQLQELKRELDVHQNIAEDSEFNRINSSSEPFNTPSEFSDSEETQGVQDLLHEIRQTLGIATPMKRKKPKQPVEYTYSQPMNVQKTQHPLDLEEKKEIHKHKDKQLNIKPIGDTTLTRLNKKALPQNQPQEPQQKSKRISKFRLAELAVQKLEIAQQEPPPPPPKPKPKRMPPIIMNVQTEKPKKEEKPLDLNAKKKAQTDLRRKKPQVTSTDIISIKTNEIPQQSKAPPAKKVERVNKIQRTQSQKVVSAELPKPKPNEHPLKPANKPKTAEAKPADKKPKTTDKNTTKQTTQKKDDKTTKTKTQNKEEKKVEEQVAAKPGKGEPLNATDDQKPIKSKIDDKGHKSKSSTPEKEQEKKKSDILSDVSSFTSDKSSNAKTEKVDSFESTIKTDKVDSFESTSKVEKVDSFESTSKVEKVDSFESTIKTEKVDSFESTSKVEKVDSFESTTKTDKVDSFESTSKVEKVDSFDSTIKNDSFSSPSVKEEKVDSFESTVKTDKVDSFESTSKVEKVDSFESSSVKPKPTEKKADTSDILSDTKSISSGLTMSNSFDETSSVVQQPAPKKEESSFESVASKKSSNAVMSDTFSASTSSLIEAPKREESSFESAKKEDSTSIMDSFGSKESDKHFLAEEPVIDSGGKKDLDIDSSLGPPLNVDSFKKKSDDDSFAFTSSDGSIGIGSDKDSLIATLTNDQEKQLDEDIEGDELMNLMNTENIEAKKSGANTSEDASKTGGNSILSDFSD